MAASAISAPANFSIASRNRASSLSIVAFRNSTRSMVHASLRPYGGSSTIGLSNRIRGVPLKLEEQGFRATTNRSYGTIEATMNPPVMPDIMTPEGPLDLANVLFRNRIVFIGQPINQSVAVQVISQLVTLATIDEDADILVYLNCIGGNVYSVLAIYDCMCWIKPKVGTVCFGAAASHGAFILAGGEKGMRYAMPNARIMIHQPNVAISGPVQTVKRQISEGIYSRNKMDQLYATITGQPLEKVKMFTERDRYFSASEAMEFGLIDGIVETEY